MQPSLSVVIPTRNRASTVVDAVGSVLGQNCDGVEVVVYDDGSVDDTMRQLAAIEDARLRIGRSATPRGANHARNRGAELAAAPLLAFLDSDDRFVSGRAARLVRMFQSEGDVDASIDGFVDVGTGEEAVHQLPAGDLSVAEIRHMLIAHMIPITNSTLTLRRRVFEAVGGFDEALHRHQDRDLLLRLNQPFHLRFGTAVDVLKFRGEASISHSFRGYISGLDALAARLTDEEVSDYRELFRYLAARGIFRAAFQGHLRSAWREAADLARAAHLRDGPVLSMLGYFEGKRQRRQLMRPSGGP